MPQEKLKLDEKDVAAEIEQRKAQFKAEKMDYSPEMVESEVRETFKTVVVMEWLKDTVKRTVEPYVA